MTFMWQTKGACATVDPEEFFPHRGQSTKHAKALCTKCLVRLECLQFALDNNEKFGVWGGTSERQRERMRRGHR